MKITINNCNNIDSGEINISEGKLNIKYGINGTGKSTIAKAIQYKTESQDNLKTLLPFKLQKENSENLTPTIEIDPELKEVLTFNEEYVKQFIFKQEELIENSFEIFINTEKYKERLLAIENIIAEIKNVFKDDKDLNNTIGDLEELSSNFKVSKDGISKSSKGYKCLAHGNNIENIPEELKEYSLFLKDKVNVVKWLKWQEDGKSFLEMSDDCPYCVTTVIGKKEKIQQVTEKYDKTTIKNLNLLIQIIEKLGDYFTNETKDTLKDITTKKDGLKEDEISFLVTVKTQIDNLINGLSELRDLSFINFKDTEKVPELLTPLKINLALYDRLSSKKTESIVEKLNYSIEKVLQDTSKLQGEINQQKNEIKKLVKKYETEINQFLKNAGYRYKVKISEGEQDYKLRLQHLDSEEALTNGDQHLSFGEKNAFALVLFMYEALSKKPELIILDDPISSFDKNKKYAILDMLFRGRTDACFKQKTVLMLTHDIEPIIDTIKTLNRKFSEQTIAHFLESHNNELKEQEIGKDDILTFPQICTRVIEDKKINTVVKLIYLRRNLEILDDKGVEYQLISDFIHKRNKAEAKEYRKEYNDSLTDEQFEKDFTIASKSIVKRVSDFNYEDILEKLIDTNQMKTLYESSENSYEKLQLFRIMSGDFDNTTDLSDVMKKFINETYHIENELISQLDPKKYDLIPEFIIDECDEYISTIT